MSACSRASRWDLALAVWPMSGRDVMEGERHNIMADASSCRLEPIMRRHGPQFHYPVLVCSI